MADTSITVNIGGKDYKISQLEVSDYREVESFIRQSQLRDYYASRDLIRETESFMELSSKIKTNRKYSKDDAEILIEQLQKQIIAERASIVKSILTSPIDDDTRKAFEKSLEGLMFILWKSIKKNQPQMTYESVCELLKNDEEFTKITEVFSGMNEEKSEIKNPRRVKADVS